jgi:hypothetical protein
MSSGMRKVVEGQGGTRDGITKFDCGSSMLWFVGVYSIVHILGKSKYGYLVDNILVV